MNVFIVALTPFCCFFIVYALYVFIFIIRNCSYHKHITHSYHCCFYYLFFYPQDPALSVFVVVDIYL